MIIKTLVKQYRTKAKELIIAEIERSKTNDRKGNWDVTTTMDQLLEQLSESKNSLDERLVIRIRTTDILNGLKKGLNREDWNKIMEDVR